MCKLVLIYPVLLIERTMHVLVDKSVPLVDYAKVSVLRFVVRPDMQSLVIDDIAGPLAGWMRCMVGREVVPSIWGHATS